MAAGTPAGNGGVMLEKRLNQVLVLFGVLNLLVVAHLVRLQVVERDHWEEKGEVNRSQEVLQVQVRGPILLKDGRVVVKSERRYDLKLDPGRFRDAWPPGALTVVLRKLKESESFWLRIRRELDVLKSLIRAAVEELEKAVKEKEEEAVKKQKEDAVKALKEELRALFRGEAEKRAAVLNAVLLQPEAEVRRLLDSPVNLVLNVKESLLDGRLGAQMDTVLGRRAMKRLEKLGRSGMDPWRKVGDLLGLNPEQIIQDRKLREEAGALAAVQGAFGEAGKDLKILLWEEVLQAERNAKIRLETLWTKGKETPFDWGEDTALLSRHARSLYRKTTRDHLGRARYPNRNIPYEAAVEIHRARSRKQMIAFSTEAYSGRKVDLDLLPHVVGCIGSPLHFWILDDETRPLWECRAAHLFKVMKTQQEILSRPGPLGPEARTLFNALERAKLERPHASDRDVGRAGIELWYNDRLWGKKGSKRVLREPGKKRPYVIHASMPVDGKPVVLTLEPHLQAYALELLAGDRESRKGDTERAGECRGALVALDPRTGEILVLATDPSFSLEDYQDKGKYDFLDKDDRTCPLQNRALKRAAPGSIFKVFTALVGLENGMISPTEALQCWGRSAGARKPRCAATGHSSGGSVLLEEALGRSCNAYFAGVANRLWDRGKSSAFLHRFMDFHLDEVPLWGNNTLYHRGLVQDGNPLYKGTLRNMAIGQDPVEISPLQAAELFSILARQGWWRPPFITYQSPYARVEEDQVVQPKTVSALLPGLKAVVKSGTARKAFARHWKACPLEVAGKTGTTTFWSKPTHAWFACFAPVSDPEIVVVVFLEHRGKGGGEAAAPVAVKFLKHYLEKGRLEADPRLMELGR